MIEVSVQNLIARYEAKIGREAGQVLQLEAQLEAVKVEYEAKVVELNQQITELLSKLDESTPTIIDGS